LLRENASGSGEKGEGELGRRSVRERERRRGRERYLVSSAM